MLRVMGQRESETDGALPWPGADAPDSIRKLLPRWRRKHDRSHPDYVSAPQMARSLPFHESVINQIERGRMKSPPSLKQLEAIAEFFGKDPTEIAEYRAANVRRRAAAAPCHCS
jgi:transcriptional regulator with XRE-family HTH domain